MNLNTTPFRIDPAHKHGAAASHHGPAAPSQHEKLVQQTRKWVAQSFFEPMLKQMRQSPFHSDLLDGGKGGQAFAGMFDERLSERMSGPASNSLVNAIVRRIEAKQAYTKHQTAFKQQVKSPVQAERQASARLRGAQASHPRLHFHGAKHVAPGL